MTVKEKERATVDEIDQSSLYKKKVRGFMELFLLPRGYPPSVPNTFMRNRASDSLSYSLRADHP